MYVQVHVGAVDRGVRLPPPALLSTSSFLGAARTKFASFSLPPFFSPLPPHTPPLNSPSCM